MLTMRCDACGSEVPENVNGVARLRFGPHEYVFHLCVADRDRLTEVIGSFLAAHPWKEVGKGGGDR